MLGEQTNSRRDEVIKAVISTPPRPKKGRATHASDEGEVSLLY